MNVAALVRISDPSPVSEELAEALERGAAVAARVGAIDTAEREAHAAARGAAGRSPTWSAPLRSATRRPRTSGAAPKAAWPRPAR